MKLYGYWRSSSSWRVRIALEWKCVAYENHPVHLVRDGGEQHKDDYRAKNPLEQVPLLELEGGAGPVRLTQSVAIIEYLEERFPKPPLLPEQAELRARAREVTEIINSGIQPFQNTGTLNELRARGVGDGKAWAAHFITKGLDALEARLAPTAGKYCIDDAVSLADIFLVPQLYSARRFGVDLDPYPTLCRIEKACEELEAFRRAHPSAQPDAET